MKPAIQSFTANPTAITPGQTSSLTWQVSNADQVIIDQGVGVVTGTQKTVTPSKTTTYTLIASNTIGSDTSQATISVSANLAAFVTTLSSSSRTTPLIGFNAVAHHTIANWKQQDFRDSAATLNASILRHPGGTNANYWDWQTGWVQTGSWVPPSLANVNPKGQNRYEEFKLGVDACKSASLMVLNFHYSTISYELHGLRHAQSLGFPIQYIEIGNEHNLSPINGVDQFIPPGKYGSGAAVWADSLKNNFPNAKICLVGSEPPNHKDWHDSLFLYSPKIEALSFHIYLGAGNNDGIFNATRALSIPFSSQGLLFRYANSGFTGPEVPSNIEVWATEFNMSEQLAGATLQHNDTWTHALYVSCMSHLLLSIPKVTMLVNHALTNQLEFAAIDPNTHRITANAIAMKLLGEASKGLSNAAEINFASQPQVTYQSTSYPSLIGWKFWNGSIEKAWVVNLSSSPLLISANGIIAGTKKYKFYTANPAFQVKGIKSLTLSSGTTSDEIAIPAYSIGLVEK